MTMLARFRLSPRWLVLLVGLAAVAVTTVALLPHDDGNGEDFDCLVCKAGHEPLTELYVEATGVPPVVRTSSAPVYRSDVHADAVVDAGSARAPPA